MDKDSSPPNGSPDTDADAITVAMLSTAFQEWGKLLCALEDGTWLTVSLPMVILSRSRLSCFVTQDTDLWHNKGIRFLPRGPPSTPASTFGARRASGSKHVLPSDIVSHFLTTLPRA